MKPEEQIIAIAKACGWKLFYQNRGGGPLYETKPEGHSWPIWQAPTAWHQTEEAKKYMTEPDSGLLYPSNYLTDLNAMHEAEKVLDEAQCALYCEMLVGNEPINHACEADGYYFHATAAQRAEAFLRTLNLWKD